MTIQNRTTLKSYFQTNDVPTEAQFSDLIDSAVMPADSPNFSSITVQAVSGSPATAVFNCSAGRSRFFGGQTNGNFRWLFYVGNDTPETGSNAGSDFLLQCHDDSGVSLGFPLTIIRSNLATYFQGVYNNTTAVASNVNVDAAGFMRRSTSSILYKTDVQPMTSEERQAILNLQPVTYKSICPGDDHDARHLGFIAEQVEEVEPRLVQYEGSAPRGVQYDRITVGLVAMVQDLNRRIEELENA